MGRKPVLEGGKRDEIVNAAMKLFFQNGYEATSVRMILDEVGGEVGMFYHYFHSKEDLFQKVIERFFANYTKSFIETVKQCTCTEEFIDSLLSQFNKAYANYQSIADNMHWSIQYSMAAKTIEQLVPAVMELLYRIGYSRRLPVDIVAGQLLYAVSATLHSPSYAKMSPEQQRAVIEELVQRILQS